jgi:hypothetical protein
MKRAIIDKVIFDKFGTKLNPTMVWDKGAKHRKLDENDHLTLLEGDKTKFFGRWFVWSGSCWVLDEVCNNVISKKNAGLKGYRIHSYSM